MFEYNTIEEALEELRQGHLIMCTDDPDRENEGDLICAAQFATTENVNFMATNAKGLICMPMSAEYVQKLQFPQMVTHNTDNHETAFTVSIDHVSTTTGISAAERSITATPSSSESFLILIVPPFARNSSIILSATTIGMCSSMSWSVR